MAFLYHEPGDAGNSYRDAYSQCIADLIADMQASSASKRDDFMRGLHEDPESYRAKLGSMLGWPLNTRNAHPILSTRETFVATDDLCSIYRVELEVLPGFWLYGLWLVNTQPGPLPAVIFQHGGQGTPEVCAGFIDSGNYNDAVRRILRQGVHVFAPQLLLWRQGEFGQVPYDRQVIDRQLKQLGSSIAALELFCLQKAVDFVEASSAVQPDGIGMAGLSYGGFYALFAAALDTRLKATLSSCFFNDRVRYGWPDWVWFNAANTFQDSEIGALVCPRALYVEIANHDELFDPDAAEEEISRLRRYYAPCPEQLDVSVFDGIHEFSPEDGGIRFLIKHLQ